jgi:YbbR domain-containing protein
MPFNLRENLHLRIFALLVAIIAWMVVRSEEERVKDFAVPVDYVGISAALEISGRTVDTVAVRLRGPEPILRSITADRLGASIDLSRATLGEQHIHLTPDLFKVPGGAEMERVEPDLVTVKIEKRASREVPVVAEFSGRPPSGYRKSGHTIRPSVVTIVGPASEVSGVSRVLTGTIVLEGEVKDLDLELRPIPDAPAGSHVRILSPQEPVRVHVTIEPAP